MTEQLRPRDIQARIRAGASVDDLAAGSDMTVAMIERFAGPVLAERAHIASAAMTSTVRRTGEPSSSRHLRLAVTDRLAKAGVEPDSVEWDAYRLPDGRWAVTAAYVVERDPRTAEFAYTPAGRFCVPANQEARELLGERPWAPLGEADPDDEPTIDLADELAIVRAVQSPTAPEAAEPTPVPVVTDVSTEPAEPTTQDPAADDTATDGSAGNERASGPALVAVPEPDPEAPSRVDALELGEDDSGSQLDRLFAMMGPDASAATEPVSDTEPAGDTGPVEPAEADHPEPEAPAPTTRRASSRRRPGPSDASAVPDTGGESWAPSGSFESASATPPTVPLEPSLFDDDPQTAALLDAATDPPPTDAPAAESAPAEPSAPRGTGRRRRSGTSSRRPDASSEPAGSDDTAGPTAAETDPIWTTPELAVEGHPPAAATAPAETPAEGPADAAVPEPAAVDEEPADQEPAKPKKRKGRASVPSWDEIMFGSPRRR